MLVRKHPSYFLTSADIFIEILQGDWGGGEAGFEPIPFYTDLCLHKQQFLLRSDEGLTLEKSAFKLFMVVN